MQPKAQRLAERAAKAGAEAEVTELPVKKKKKKQQKEPGESDLTPSSVEAAPAEATGKDRKRKKWNQEVASGGAQSLEGLPPKWRGKDKAEDWRKKELEKRNSTKYHYLKFIEKQKVERKLKSCRRSILAATDAGKTEEVSALKAQLKSHLADYEYIEHYPRHLPYNSLFPKEDSELSRRRREEIRKVIQAALSKEQQRDDNAHSAGNSITTDSSVPAHAKKQKIDEAADADKESTSGTKKKKKKTKNTSADAASDSTANAGGVKKRKGFQDSPASIETSGAKTKKVRKSGGAESSPPTGSDDAVHPSWQARKSAKNSGAMVKSAGSRQVFGSDDENE